MPGKVTAGLGTLQPERPGEVKTAGQMLARKLEKRGLLRNLGQFRPDGFVGEGAELPALAIPVQLFQIGSDQPRERLLLAPASLWAGPLHSGVEARNTGLGVAQQGQDGRGKGLIQKAGQAGCCVVKLVDDPKVPG